MSVSVHPQLSKKKKLNYWSKACSKTKRRSSIAAARWKRQLTLSVFFKVTQWLKINALLFYYNNGNKKKYMKFYHTKSLTHFKSSNIIKRVFHWSRKTVMRNFHQNQYRVFHLKQDLNHKSKTVRKSLCILCLNIRSQMVRNVNNKTHLMSLQWVFLMRWPSSTIKIFQSWLCSEVLSLMVISYDVMTTGCTLTPSRMGVVFLICMRRRVRSSGVPW